MANIESTALKTRSNLRDGFAACEPAEFDTNVLGQFIARQRWFGGKAEPIDKVVVKDIMPLFAQPLPMAVLRVDVATANHAATYQIFVAAVAEDEAAKIDARAQIGRYVARGDKGLLCEAIHVPAFRSELAQLLSSGGSRGSKDITWNVERVVSKDQAPFATATSKVSTAEQSNSSIIYGDVAILKLYRRLEAGENPDVEIGRFLTEKTSFAHVPAVFGAIYFGEKDGPRTVAGMLARLVPAIGDGWSHALSVLEPYLAGDPSATQVPFIEDAFELGRVTRGLHEALASQPTYPGFEVTATEPDDVRVWAERVAAEAEETITAFAHSRAAEQGVALAPAMQDLLTQASARVKTRTAQITRILAQGAGSRIRHHGDYHLGQVLRQKDGQYAIIDFEGEPARPLGERRAHHSPLRDVAGMLRSLGYAAAAVAQRLPEGPEAAQIRERGAVWEQVVRKVYLLGYAQVPAENLATLLPPTAEATRSLTELFELEKAFYELRYEMNNRPAWVGIPLHGIARILAGE